MRGEQLRCHHCGRHLTVTTAPMVIVGLFRASAREMVVSVPDGGLRKMCRACRWLNVFGPSDLCMPAAADMMMLK